MSAVDKWLKLSLQQEQQRSQTQPRKTFEKPAGDVKPVSNLIARFQTLATEQTTPSTSENTSNAVEKPKESVVVVEEKVVVVEEKGEIVETREESAIVNKTTEKDDSAVVKAEPKTDAPIEKPTKTVDIQAIEETVEIVETRGESPIVDDTTENEAPADVDDEPKTNEPIGKPTKTVVIQESLEIKEFPVTKPLNQFDFAKPFLTARELIDDMDDDDHSSSSSSLESISSSSASSPSSESSSSSSSAASSSQNVVSDLPPPPLPPTPPSTSILDDLTYESTACAPKPFETLTFILHQTGIYSTSSASRKRLSRKISATLPKPNTFAPSPPASKKSNSLKQKSLEAADVKEKDDIDKLRRSSSTTLGKYMKDRPSSSDKSSPDPKTKSLQFGERRKQLRQQRRNRNK